MLIGPVQKSESKVYKTDPSNEIFDLVDDDGKIIGQERRGVVHTTGLLHRAVYVWVFNTNNAVLLQRRSLSKLIGPGEWDLSTAEHLSQGETFKEAAIRGLKEELGIDNVSIDGPLTSLHKNEYHQGPYHDVELVQSFIVRGFDGEVQFQDGEVIDAEWVDMSDLAKAVHAHPEKYTNWMINEGAILGYW